MGIITLFEYLGTFMFAFSGAAVACEEKLDYLGVFFLAAVTALGGGIIRDAVLDNGLPYAFRGYIPYLFIFLAVVWVIKLGSRIHDNIIITAFDAIGLGAFTVSAGINAINAGSNIITTIFCCFATAVGGGIVRDIVVNRKPYVLRKEIYAAVSVEGAVYMYFLKDIISSEGLALSCFAIIFVTRMLCVFKNLNFPVAEKNIN